MTTFNDYTESKDDALDILESIVFGEIRFNFKLMQILYPSKNFSISQAILDFRPVSNKPNVRSIKITDDATELARRTAFSFAVLDMMQTPPSTKLAMMQEHVLEKRYAKLISILENGGRFLRTELKDRGLLNDEQIRALREDLFTKGVEDINLLSPISNWHPENYVNGNWIQTATLM